MSLQRPKSTKFKMWKAIIHRKRKYSDVLPDSESYAALAAMQGGSAATLPPSLEAFRACKYFFYSTIDGMYLAALIVKKHYFFTIKYTL